MNKGPFSAPVSTTAEPQLCELRHTVRYWTLGVRRRDPEQVRQDDRIAVRRQYRVAVHLEPPYSALVIEYSVHTDHDRQGDRLGQRGGHRPPGMVDLVAAGREEFLQPV